MYISPVVVWCTWYTIWWNMLLNQNDLLGLPWNIRFTLMLVPHSIVWFWFLCNCQACMHICLLACNENTNIWWRKCLKCWITLFFFSTAKHIFAVVYPWAFLYIPSTGQPSECRWRHEGKTAFLFTCLFVCLFVYLHLQLLVGCECHVV